MDKELLKMFCDGRYESVFYGVYNKDKLEFDDILLLRDSYIKDNNLYACNKLCDFVLALNDQNLSKTFFSNNIIQWLKTYNVQSCFAKVPELAKITNDLPVDIRDYNKAETIVFPIIWPIAFGDMIIVNQHIRNWKNIKDDKKKIIVIAPMNRPEIKELFELNDAIDVLIDITLDIDKEKNRLESLNATDENGILITVKQNIIIEYLINSFFNNCVISLTRYLPVLSGNNIINTGRIWENKASHYLDSRLEWGKLIDQNEPKQNKIVVHFREANYGDPARNVNINWQIEFLKLLEKWYPDYYVVRLGDNSMTPLPDLCTDLTDKNLSVKEQIKHIQEAKLFIGCHSAPQMLAVACSDTPIICTHYTHQETYAQCPESDIARISYEPVGDQVKKILYNKMFDKDGNELFPIQNNPMAVRTVCPTPEEVLQAVKEVLI